MRTRRLLAVAVLAASATTLRPRLALSEGARVFTLAQAERAARKQPQMLVAHSAFKVAQGQADQVKASFLPQVTATAQYTRETGNLAPTPTQRNLGAGDGTSLTKSFDYWQLQIGATQLIFDFGKTSGRYHAAENMALSQKAAERTTELDAVLAVRRAYFGARAMKALVGVAKDTLDDQNRHLVQVHGFFQVGTQPEIAVAQQEAAVANAEVLLINAQNNYDTARAQLNQATGLMEGTDYDVTDDTLGPVSDEDLPFEALAAKALAARPELLTLDKQRRAEEDTIGSAKGGYGPTLSASAGASAMGVALGGLTPNWYGSLLLTWPIFEGGLTAARVRTARASLQGVSAQKALEALQVRLDVDTARLAVRAAKASIGAAERAAASAEEQLRLAEQRYATGIGNIIELNDAQVARTSAAAQVVQARYELESARAELLAALGRT